MYGFQGYPNFIAFLEEEAMANDGLLPYDPGFVYAIWAKKTNWFKFGKSKNTQRRFSEISPKLMHETILLKTWAVPFMSKAEKLLHNLYAKNRGNGEWFWLSSQEAAILLGYQNADESLNFLQCAYWLDILERYQKASPQEHESFEKEVLVGTCVLEPEINSWLQKIFSRIANRRSTCREFSDFISPSRSSDLSGKAGAA